MLIILIAVIISQCVHVLNNLIAYLNYIQEKNTWKKQIIFENLNRNKINWKKKLSPQT